MWYSFLSWNCCTFLAALKPSPTNSWDTVQSNWDLTCSIVPVCAANKCIYRIMLSISSLKCFPCGKNVQVCVWTRMLQYKANLKLIRPFCGLKIQGWLVSSVDKGFVVSHRNTYPFLAWHAARFQWYVPLLVPLNLFFSFTQGHLSQYSLGRFNHYY